MSQKNVHYSLHCATVQSNIKSRRCGCQFTTVAESRPDSRSSANEARGPDVLPEDCTASRQHERVRGTVDKIRLMFTVTLKCAGVG